MPLDLGTNGVQSTDQMTVVGEGNYSAGYITTTIQPVLYQISYGELGGGQDTVGPRSLQVGQSHNFIAAQGRGILSLAIQSASTGLAGTVYGYFGEAQGLSIIASQSAQVGPQPVVTGQVGDDGTILAGSGYSVLVLGDREPRGQLRHAVRWGPERAVHARVSEFRRRPDHQGDELQRRPVRGADHGHELGRAGRGVLLPRDPGDMRGGF